MLASGGTGEDVSDHEIVEGIRLLAETEGVFAETAGGVTVAVARKLTVLCWHLLTKREDYRWARPALVANKTRAMELQAGRPQQKGKPARCAFR